MHLRSGRRRKEKLADDELPEVPIPPEVEKLADAVTLRRALAELPQPSREVLMMHHMLGFSFKEIGHILGIAAGTAKVRAHRALKVLRESVAAEHGGGP
jgi:RNA polymerase sigma-70 factor (ECF subfamily)